MPLKFEIKKIARIILIVIFLLLFFHIIFQITLIYSSNEILEKVAKLFHIDSEGNIPTYFSSLLFFISSFLLLLISKIEFTGNSKYWLILSLVFLFLSVEDFIQLHEKFTNIVFDKFHTSGALRFIWIYPAILIVILSFLYFRKFFFNLPRKIRINFIIAAGLFFTGTFALEFIGGILLSDEGEIKSNLFYILATIEETLEFLGLWFFIRSLLNYLSSIKSKFEIRLI